MTAESERLEEARRRARLPGRSGGPTSASASGAPSARTTATDGDAWDYFTHDQARSRAYRWGEDGLAGISDDQQRLCFALALWNGSDPILKERLFGLTNSEGNHGEDVKEYYFYLDSHADALVHEVPLQVSAGAPIPYDDLVDDEPRPQPPRARVRAARHRRLRRRPLLRRLRRVREGVARGHADRRSRSPTAARSRRRCTCCRRSGSATPGRGAARAARPSLRRSPATRQARRSRPSHAELGERFLVLRRAGRRCSSPRTRRTRERLFGSAEPRRRTSRTASTTTSSHGDAERREPRADRAPRRPRTTRSTVGAGRVAVAPPAAQRRRRRDAASRDPFGGLRRDAAGAPARGRRVLRVDHPAVARAPTRRASCARRSPACCGASSSTTTTSTAWLGEHGADPFEPRGAPHAQRRTGSTW